MRRISRLVLGALCVASCCRLATAGQTPAVSPASPSTSTSVPMVDPPFKRLMETPVSILDYGLEMMWRDLANTAKEPMHYYGTDGAFPAMVSINYDPRENKIWVSVESNPGTEGGSPFPVREKGSPAEVWCRTLISKLRAEMASGYPNITPKWLRYFVRGSGHYTSDAVHAELTELNATLPKRVFLRAHATSLDEAVHCTGPLIGSEILLEREPVEFIE